MSADRGAMPMVRSIGGAILLTGASFVGGAACFLSGAHSSFADLDPGRMLRPQAFAFTIGFPTLTLLGILASRTGRGPVAAGGIPLGLVAVAAGVYGWVIANHNAGTGFPIVGVGLVLAFIAAFMMSHVPADVAS